MQWGGIRSKKGRLTTWSLCTLSSSPSVRFVGEEHQQRRLVQYLSVHPVKVTFYSANVTKTLPYGMTNPIPPATIGKLHLNFSP